MRAHDEAPSKRGWPWVGGPVRDAVVRGGSGPEKFTCLYLEGSTDSLYINVYIYICGCTLRSEQPRKLTPREDGSRVVRLVPYVSRLPSLAFCRLRPAALPAAKQGLARV